MTQVDMILKHLQDYGEITTWEAIKKYGVTRISSKIHILRNKGYNIVSEKKVFKNRYGKTGTYSNYKLKENLVTNPYKSH